jgi:hypothetical protein
MKENTLHAELKEIYRLEGGKSEQWVDGYLIDVVRDDLLIEIQTQQFQALKKKLNDLLDKYPLRIVHPIARDKIIHLQSIDGAIIHRRRSTKTGKLEDLFAELVYIARWVKHPNFSMEVLITSEEEQRTKDGLGSWRRKGVSISDRRLIRILERHLLCKPEDYLRFIPFEIGSPFINKQLAERLSIPRRLATKMTYTLTQIGTIEIIGKNGRFQSYQVKSFD